MLLPLEPILVDDPDVDVDIEPAAFEEPKFSPEQPRTPKTCPAMTEAQATRMAR